MPEPEQPIPIRGRPKRKVETEGLTIQLDPATVRILETLELYGRLGTSKQEIVMYVLRSWLWENEARLRDAIKIKESPLGLVQDSE
jgi:hypothetical protein